MAVWRGFPLRKVPGYIAAQILGALVGAAVVYGNYFLAIDIFEGGSGIRTLKTAGFFGAYAVCDVVGDQSPATDQPQQADYMTATSSFFSEVSLR